MAVRFSSIARLYRIRLRARFVQELFAVLGIAIGLALLFSSQVSNTSLSGSVQELTNGIVGQMRFQVSARDSHGLPAALIQQVRAIPGVRAAAPVLEQSATIISSRHARAVDLVGADPQLARLGGRLVRGFGTFHIAKVNALMLSASLARSLGVSSLQGVHIRIGANTVDALVVPDLLMGVSNGLESIPVAIAPLAYVQGLSGMGGRLTSIFVQSTPGRDGEVLRGLRRVAGSSLNVRPATFDETLFDRAAQPTDQSTGLFSAISALVGFLFAFNALLLTVPQRRRLIEDLRLDGYTRRMIIEVLLFDALVLGLVASAVGLLLGDFFSIELFDSKPGYLSFAFPIGTRRIVTWTSIFLCVGGGMLAALVGVLGPLYSSIFSRHGEFFGPVRESRQATLWLLAAALLCLAATTLILAFAPSAAITGIVTLTAALLLSLPVLLDLLTRAFNRVQALSMATSPYLAVIELRSAVNRSRSIAVAATGAIAVFGSVAIETAHGDLQAGLNRVAHGLNATTDLWVLPAGVVDSLATTSFRGPAAMDIGRLPTVARVEAYRGSFLDIGDRRAWVIAPPRDVARPIPSGQLVSGAMRLATERLHTDGWLVLSAAIAAEHHLHVGGSFLLPSPRPTMFRIAALSTNLGWPPGAVILNAEDYRRAWDSADPSALEVGLRPGVSMAAGIREVRETLGPGSGLTVQSAAQRELGFRQTARQGLSRLNQISGLVLIAAILAMAATMGAMIWQRRSKIANMKVDGLHRGVLWRALMWESGLLLGAGCSLGAIFGLYGQVLLSRALSTVTGFPVTYAPGFPVAATSFALVTATAMLIVAVPGGLATRVGPAIALSD
jgi:putative ABC transport system permease protein